jgi:acyl-lipid omega-6 desaturase (Delta-12 desaturase)
MHRREKSLQKSLSILALFFLGYVVTFLAIAFVPCWPLRIVLASANGLFIGALFIIGHDACHQSLTPSRVLNCLIGRLTFLPALTTFSAWEVAHNQLHHGWTNFYKHDVFVPLSKQEFDALPRWRRYVERLYRTTAGIAFYYQVEVLFKHLLVPRKDDFKRMTKPKFAVDILLVTGYVLAQLFILGFVLPFAALELGLSIPSFPVLLLCHVLLPYAVWAWAYAAVTLQHHTHPKVPWFDNADKYKLFNAQLRANVRITMPRVAQMFFLNVFDHTAHHVDSKIPLYRLHESQAALEDAFPGQVTVQIGSIRQLRNTMRICKLYDYDNHQWLDLNGNVTSKVDFMHGTGARQSRLPRRRATAM